MKCFKSRQDWKTPKIDIAPIRIRYHVTGASISVIFDIESPLTFGQFDNPATAKICK